MKTLQSKITLALFFVCCLFLASQLFGFKAQSHDNKFSHVLVSFPKESISCTDSGFLIDVYGDHYIAHSVIYIGNGKYVIHKAYPHGKIDIDNFDFSHEHAYDLKYFIE